MLGETFKYQNSGHEEKNPNQQKWEDKTQMLRSYKIEDYGVGSLHTVLTNSRSWAQR